ncbi:hypothetical protein ACFY8B_21515 [Streptomyces sp. NPDC012751]|uniref:hypothetical protein n=1 Tax=Streptomyces sp. NPDC012751 TaxID=3364846 RepID=UPI003681CBB1
MFDRIPVAIESNRSGRGALRAAGAPARSTGAAVRVPHVVPSAVAGDTVVRLEDDAEGEAVLREALDLPNAEGTGADGWPVRPDRDGV